MRHWQWRSAEATCKLVFIDIAMPTHIPLVNWKSPGFCFLGLFPLSSSLPFPVIMTHVVDLKIYFDNQRLIGESQQKGTAMHVVISCCTGTFIW